VFARLVQRHLVRGLTMGAVKGSGADWDGAGLRSR
jgi:hypothetical protein